MLLVISMGNFQLGFHLTLKCKIPSQLASACCLLAGIKDKVMINRTGLGCLVTPGTTAKAESDFLQACRVSVVKTELEIPFQMCERLKQRQIIYLYSAT